MPRHGATSWAFSRKQQAKNMMDFELNSLWRVRFAQAMAVVLALISTTTSVGADLTRAIRVSPDGRFLAEPDGTPFFYLAENAEYLLWKLTREETDLYLKDRTQKGFTVIMAHLIPRSD